MNGSTSIFIVTNAMAEHYGSISDAVKSVKNAMAAMKNADKYPTGPRLMSVHLPFPQSRPLSIAEVMEKAGVDLEYSTEVQDIVDELVRLEVIEVV